MSTRNFENSAVIRGLSAKPQTHLKVFIVALYVLACGATAAWVFLFWPPDTTQILVADASAVAGALEGRTLVLVTNNSEYDWSDTELVLNDEYMFSAGHVAKGQQLSIPVDEFVYSYAIPRNWNAGQWKDLSPVAQPRLQDERSIEPRVLSIHAAEGIVRLDLQAGGR